MNKMYKPLILVVFSIILAIISFEIYVKSINHIVLFFSLMITFELAYYGIVGLLEKNIDSRS